MDPAPSPTSYRLDLHVHTRASPDSRMEADAAMRAACSAGLDGIAITDHNSMDAIPNAREWLNRSPDRFLTQRGHPLQLIPGVEVSTREGHLLAFFLETPPTRDRTLAETIDSVHRAGGLAVLSHPYRRAHGAGPSLHPPYPPLDGVETRNGHNYAALNQRAERLAALLGVPRTGGSDAHRPEEVGRCFTEIPRLEPLGPTSLLRKDIMPGGNALSRRAGLTVGVQNALKRARRGMKPV